MKYDKGSFIVVPNKDILRTLKPHAQVLFMWLCSYANTTGKCFPSRRQLSRDCNMSVRQVVDSINDLVEAGIVESRERKTEDGNNKTNLYTVIIGGAPYAGGGAYPARGGAPYAHGTQSTELNPIKNTYAKADASASTSKKEKKPDTSWEPMSLEEFVASCRSSAHRHIRLIGEYADTRRPNYSTKGQWRQFISRNIRASRSLSPYEDSQIDRAMIKLKKDTVECGGFLTKWTLETLIKYLD